ncbi:unnamed protein product [Blepharisma stoltei]|uniref:Uncharacterized protein n=1 Tax=Blepharisma stoltei TaxID=1481888 RepID=A0AAU9JG60_9CILI|nr:unnamed protein product [Blepharisma stoltei]
MFSIDSVSWGRGMKFASIGVKTSVRVDNVSLPLEPSEKVDTRTNVPLSHCRPLSVSGSIEALPPAGESAAREEHNAWQRQQEKEEKLKNFQLRTQEIVKQRLKCEKEELKQELEWKAKKFNAIRAYCVEKKVGVSADHLQKKSKPTESKTKQKTEKSMEKREKREKQAREEEKVPEYEIYEEVREDEKPAEQEIEQVEMEIALDQEKYEAEPPRSFKSDFSGYKKQPLNIQQMGVEENFDIVQDNPPQIHYDEGVEQAPFLNEYKQLQFNMFSIPEEEVEKVQDEEEYRNAKKGRFDKVFQKLESEYENPKEYLKNEVYAQEIEERNDQIEEDREEEYENHSLEKKQTRLCFSDEPLPQMVSLVLQNSRAALKAMGAHIIHSLKDHETAQVQAKVTAKSRSSKDEMLRKTWDQPLFDDHALEVALVRKIAEIQEHHAASMMKPRAKSAGPRVAWGTPLVSELSKKVQFARSFALNKERNREKKSETSPDIGRRSQTPSKEERTRYMRVDDRKKSFGPKLPAEDRPRSRSPLRAKSTPGISPGRSKSNLRNQKLAEKVEQLAADVKEGAKLEPPPINYSKRHLDSIKYITALKRVVRDQLKEKFSELIPAVCTCGSMNRVKNLNHPVMCANNCPFYKRQQEFQRASTEMIQSFKQSQWGK